MQAEHSKQPDFFKDIFKTREAKTLEKILTLIESKQQRSEEEARDLCQTLCHEIMQLFSFRRSSPCRYINPYREALKKKVQHFQLLAYDLCPEVFIAEVKATVLDYKSDLPNKGEVNVTLFGLGAFTV